MRTWTSVTIALFNLLAQGDSTLHGIIRDSRGAPIAGAIVHVQLKTETFIVHSDAKGSYRISSLQAGSYTLRAEMTNFSEATFGPFSLGQNETKTVDLTLKPTVASLEFFDEPKFTVAGVTNYTYFGGHGSDTVLRSKEELSKATASLTAGKDGPRSEKLLRDAIAREPGNAELHHSLAETDERLGKPLEAVREYQRAAELDANERNLFDWGTELLTHRAPDPANEVFTRGIRLFPRSARMLLGSAVALYASGAYDQAAQRFFEATDLNPDDPGPYLFLGKVQSPEITESKGFLDRLARFARLQPENAWANYYYGVALWKLGKDAETLLEKAVRLDPGLGVGYLQLGIVYSEKRDLPAAIRAYQRAIEVNPQLEQAHYRLAQAYRETGETLNARKELEIFQQVSKTSAEALEREHAELQQFVVTLRH